MPKKLLIVLVGPTAVGKTTSSVELAKALSCSIVNADSRQVFKELSIGTAKPTNDEMAGVKHYFVGDRSIFDEISAGIFERETLKILDIEFKERNICIMSGGSGLYIDAVCYGLNEFPAVPNQIRSQLMYELEKNGLEELYNELLLVDPEYAAEIEPQNSQRIIRALEIYRSSNERYSDLRIGMQGIRNFETLFIGLERSREELYDRINRRMDRMIEDGLFEEAMKFEKHRHLNALQTVGYKEIYLYHDKQIDREETIRILKRNSRRFAKRQMTWFNRNTSMHWFHPDQVKLMLDLIQKTLDT